MKILILMALALIISNFTANTVHAEVKATVCQDIAVAGAKALFNLNNPEKGKLKVTLTLVEEDNSSDFDGGYEVWDISFTKNNVKYSPYRMTVNYDGDTPSLKCSITAFGLPTNS